MSLRWKNDNEKEERDEKEDKNEIDGYFGKQIP